MSTGRIYQKAERGNEQDEVDGAGVGGAVTGVQGVKLEFDIGYSKWVL